MKPFNYVVITFYFSAITISVLQQKVSFSSGVSRYDGTKQRDFHFSPEKAEKDGRGIDPEGVPTCLNDSNACLLTGNT